MANRRIDSLPGAPQKWAIDTSGNLDVGNGLEGRASSIVIQFEVVTTTVTVKPQKRLTGSGQAFADCAYFDELASPGTEVAAGTAKSTDGIIKVIADGCDVRLVFVVTGGTAEVEWLPIQG